MSLVERLAKEYKADRLVHSTDPKHAESEARWWLNAIAEELESDSRDIPRPHRDSIARYLRAEAAPDRETEE